MEVGGRRRGHSKGVSQEGEVGNRRCGTQGALFCKKDALRRQGRLGFLPGSLRSCHQPQASAREYTENSAYGGHAGLTKGLGGHVSYSGNERDKKSGMLFQ